MKKSVLVMASGLCFLLLTSPSPGMGTTYYVRPDGGTAEQCSGTTDAPYPGSGTNQLCAWEHPFWALDGTGSWKIQGGDTLIIKDGSYEMGYGAPNSSWCEPEGAFECYLPPLPSGPDSGHPTRVLGEGWDTGCETAPELWGTQRANHILNLAGTSYATVQCLELTDHSGCVEFHSSRDVACERDTYPFGEWAAAGISASDSSQVTLKDLDIHGLAVAGVRAGRISDWTVENVRIAGNGWVGWEGDIDGDDSNSGTLTFRKWVVEWNGCAETYPDKEPDHCWDQTAGGYGDGVGTGATGGHWIIEDSSFRYNTSDGLDLLYVGRAGEGDSKVEVRRTVAVGNAGNPIKIGGAADIVNTLAIANCGFFDGKAFGQEMSDHCRAGGNSIALNLHRGDSVRVVNCTVVGESDALLEAECDESGRCDGTESVSLLNSIFVGYEDFLQKDWGDRTAFVWDPDRFTRGRIDYNVIYGVKEEDETCPFGANDICADPLFVNGELGSFDGHLQAESPAIDSGLSTGELIPPGDLDGGARPAGDGVDRGAYEYGASTDLPNISVSPRAHDFGSIAPGAVATPQQFTITNIGDQDLVVSGMRLSDTVNYNLDVNYGPNACGSETPACASGGSCGISIVFSPTEEGRLDAILTIVSNDPDSPEIIVTLTGSGGVQDGCFLETVAYGSPMVNDLGELRAFRDTCLVKSGLGRALVKYYHKYSSSLTEKVKKHEAFRVLARVALTPLVYVIRAMELSN